MVTATMKLRHLLLARKAMTNVQFSSVQLLSCVRLFATS